MTQKRKPRGTPPTQQQNRAGHAKPISPKQRTWTEERTNGYEVTVCISTVMTK
jgi:hypothetical protein